MQSLVVTISNPETVHAITEAARRQGTTPEAAALELLEAAVLAQKPFEQMVEPIARSFDESGMSEEELYEPRRANPKGHPRRETSEQVATPELTPRRL